MRLAVLGMVAALAAFGEAGRLIPGDTNRPDDARLRLAEMEIRVRIDNGHARVNTKQIFANETDNVLEGTWLFTLPGRATLSDFAVWDDVTRIPGVILERRRAEEIYTQARDQAIDPGLLQQGERDNDEARRTSIFSARLVPIPARGAKRVEFEYQERLPVEQMQSFFAVPLRPDSYGAMTAARLSISVEIASAHALRAVEVLSKTYPLTVREQTASSYRAEWQGEKVTLGEDLALRYTIDPRAAAGLRVLAHRENAQGPGFFEVSALAPPDAPAKGGPRTVIAAFDNSLSMQWEKLERSYLALDRLLRSLRPEDRLNVILFNSEATAVFPKPEPGTPENVQRALDAVRASRIAGGTNLQAALRAAMGQPVTGSGYAVLLGDGGATRGTDISNRRLTAWFAAQRKSWRPKLYVFAVGDDANMPLLSEIGDVVEWVRSTEPAEFKLNSFLSKIGRSPASNFTLTAEPASNTRWIYPLEASVFGGSMQWWVGQYLQPAAQRFAVGARRTTVNLPATELGHPQLPRAWAQARVNALLAKIEREGEDAATIDEIIQLSRKYKFVTPYTSFLAVPRSLLRPRLIRPGDPILRVRTDPSISSVVAMFPFGEVKPLRHLKDDDVWQTRFLAPPDMADGTHTVRLILRDRQGRVFRESKTFVIASKPPVVRVRLDRNRYRRGEVVKLRVNASQMARTITARMYGVSPVSVRWNPSQAASTGEFVVPAHLPAGRYPLQVIAEDFAHNIGAQEVSIEILP